MDLQTLRRRPAAASAQVVEASTAAPATLGIAHMQAMLEALPLLSWLQGTTAHAAYYNPAWRQWSGCADITLQDWTTQTHPDDHAQAVAAWQQAQANSQPTALDCRMHHHSGDYRWCRIQIAPTSIQTDAQPVWLVNATDIHDHATAELALQKDVRAQTQMLDVSVDCIKIIRPDGTLSHMNKSGCDALGVAADSGFGMRWLNLLPPSIRQRGKRALRAAASGKNARFSGMSEVPNQKPQYWDNILTPIKGSDGSVSSILCVSRDITDQREAELQMRDASEQDDLTGLPNRRAFKARVKQIIKHSREHELMFGVMLLDLDHFKHINDTHGPCGR